MQLLVHVGIKVNAYSEKGAIPDKKVYGANMGTTWGRQDPGGPHVSPMNLATWYVATPLAGCRGDIVFRFSWQSSRPQTNEPAPTWYNQWICYITRPGWVVFLISKRARWPYGHTVFLRLYGYLYHQNSSISCTKSTSLNVSRLVLQLSWPNPLKPGIKSRMKM